MLLQITEHRILTRGRALDLMPENKIPDYENPPISEVVSGIYFKKVPLQLPHFGLLWQKFQKQYPKFEEAMPLTPELEQGEVTDFPMPRVWFVTESGDGLVQVQQNYFLTNWRKTKPEDEYPRYAQVMKLFHDGLERFTGFLKEHELPPVEPALNELTYVNHILQGEGWGNLADIGKVFPDVAWRASADRFLPTASAVSSALNFDLPDGLGQLKVMIRSARRRMDELPVLMLEMRVRGKHQNDGDLISDEWFATAREWIVRGFADLTSDELQREFWGRVR